MERIPPVALAQSSLGLPYTQEAAMYGQEDMACDLSGYKDHRHTPRDLQIAAF